MAEKYFIPEEETLQGDDLASLQLRKARVMLAEVCASNPFYKEKFAGLDFDPASIQSLDDFRRLPFTTKSEIALDQAKNSPYGTNLTYPLERYVRLHQSSGTSGGSFLCWLDTRENWDWIMRCWGIIYRAIGVTPEDRLFFAFSFGPFLGFWAGFEGAYQLGNLALSGGGMTSAARLRFMIDNRATIVGCTPTYALHLAEVAAEEGIDLVSSSVRALLVAGEPGGNIPETKSRIQDAWGARCFDHTGMTEIGSLGIECVEDPGNTHLIESECIAEIINPKTGEPDSDGALGELVLTNLGRCGSPLIRYRTGDLVQFTREPCKCGRGYCRMLGGILGRVDDMLIIRGNNIYPSAIEAIIRRFPEIAEFRIRVSDETEMASLLLEFEPLPDAQYDLALVERISKAFQDRFNFRADIQAVAPGALPRFELKARRFVK